MHWLATLVFGLLTAIIGAIYGGYMAELSVTWLRISSFEGGAGYFVLFMILLGFIGSLIAGLIICRLAGGPGPTGIAKGFGIAVGTVVAVISVLGAMAWASADRQPLIAGQPIDLAVEVRFPPGADKPHVNSPNGDYAILQSGPKSKHRTGNLDLAAARQDDGRWIVPAQIAIHVSEGDRTLSVRIEGSETQFFNTTLPAKPAKIDDDWGPWLDAPFLGNLSKPAADAALAVRYRVVRRPPPPPEPEPAPREPTMAERKQAAYDTLSPLASTAEWLALTTLDAPEHVRQGALKTVAYRPDFAAALSARIASDDDETARDAMYLVGVMEPPPAAVADAVRAQAARVVRIAEAIDPAAEDSRDRLYAEAHVLATGVHAAAFGLRRAGVDIRPELRAMVRATYEREKASPRAIADDAERIIAYFDKLDREGTPMK